MLIREDEQLIRQLLCDLPAEQNCPNVPFGVHRQAGWRACWHSGWLAGVLPCFLAHKPLQRPLRHLRDLERTLTLLHRNCVGVASIALLWFLQQHVSGYVRLLVQARGCTLL